VKTIITPQAAIEANRRKAEADAKAAALPYVEPEVDRIVAALPAYAGKALTIQATDGLPSAAVAEIASRLGTADWDARYTPGRRPESGSTWTLRERPRPAYVPNEPDPPRYGYNDDRDNYRPAGGPSGPLCPPDMPRAAIVAAALCGVTRG
jgi:hypothetical protein